MTDPQGPGAVVVPVSVVVPTLGRTSLRGCVESLAACRPRAAEVLLVTQGEEHATAELANEFSDVNVRQVPCDGRGVARGRNLGLASAVHRLVLITDDDCTVAPDWVGTAASLAEANPGAIVT